jgi:hypothetical protein
LKIGQCSYQNNNYIIVVDKSGVYRIENNCLVNTQGLIIQAGKTPLTEYVKKLINNKEGLKIAASEDLLMQAGYILQRPIDMPEAWAVGLCKIYPACISKSSEAAILRPSLLLISFFTYSVRGVLPAWIINPCVFTKQLFSIRYTPLLSTTII